MEMPEKFAEIQRRYTSNSRGTKAGIRVVSNVNNCAKYLNTPIMCIGCGDGLEVEEMIRCLNISPTFDNIIGIEVTPDRVLTAKGRKLPVIEGTVENITNIIKLQYGCEKKFSVYSAHTLEHTFNLDLAIENIKEIALEIVVIIVPIELSGKSGNIAHNHPIANLGIIVNKFGLDWKVVIMEYRWNTELEGLIVLKRNIMNWPEKYKGSRKLLIY